MLELQAYTSILRAEWLNFYPDKELLNSCGGSLNEDPYRLMHSNTWFPAVELGIIRRGGLVGGGVSLRVGLEVSKDSLFQCPPLSDSNLWIKM